VPVFTFDIIARKLGVAKDDLCFFSALSKDGTYEIWQRIEGLLKLDEESPP
jgi:hypothetical protein